MSSPDECADDFDVRKMEISESEDNDGSADDAGSEAVLSPMSPVTFSSYQEVKKGTKGQLIKSRVDKMKMRSKNDEREAHLRTCTKKTGTLQTWL